MTGNPTHDPGNPDNVSCPRCAILIPADLEVCPFCRQAVAPEKREEGDIRKRLVPPEQFPALKSYYRLYGRWLKVAIPVLAAMPVLWLLYRAMTRLPVIVPDDRKFPIEVVQERQGGRTVLLKGKLTNRGEDIPDLSLRSIGVTAEFRMDNGGVEKQRVFPKATFRGQGALFRGESGTFEIVVPKGAKAVTLRAEVVNLGEGSPFGFGGRGIRRHPKRNRR